MSKVTQPVKNTARIHTGLPVSPPGPSDVVNSRLGLGLGGRRSAFWLQVPGWLPLGLRASDFPSPEHKQKVCLSGWEWLKVWTWELGSLDSSLGENHSI